LRRAALITALTQKAILNLRIDPVKPLLGAVSLLPVCSDFGLELRNAFLGSAKLVRKPLRRVNGMSAVLLGDISSFAQKLEDRLAGFVELRVVVSCALGRANGTTSGLMLTPLPTRLFRNISLVRHLIMASCGYPDGLKLVAEKSRGDEVGVTAGARPKRECVD
jgi:hypothetical protein